jgi:hypothetical protein
MQGCVGHRCRENDKIPAMPNPKIPQLFAVEYVRLKVKLRDRRKLSWTHWVPNKAADDLFGITPDEPYLTGDEYAKMQARGYVENGIYALWDGRDEEFITADKIEKVSTEVEKKNLTMPEILIAEAHLRNPRNVTVSPPRKRPSLQVVIDTLDDMLNGKVTLNDFFAKVAQPQRSENAANILLKATDNGYVAASGGSPVNIRPLFQDDILFQLVEIRRVQVAKGIA